MPCCRRSSRRDTWRSSRRSSRSAAWGCESSRCASRSCCGRRLRDEAAVGARAAVRGTRLVAVAACATERTMDAQSLLTRTSSWCQSLNPRIAGIEKAMAAGRICLLRRWEAASTPRELCAAGTASDQPAVCFRLAGVRQGPQRPHRRSKQALLALIHVFDHPFRQGEHGYPLFLWAAHLRRDKTESYKKNEKIIIVGTTHFRRFPAESRFPYSEIVNSPPHDAHSRSPEAKLR